MALQIGALAAADATDRAAASRSGWRARACSASVMVGGSNLGRGAGRCSRPRSCVCHRQVLKAEVPCPRRRRAQRLWST